MTGRRAPSEPAAIVLFRRVARHHGIDVEIVAVRIESSGKARVEIQLSGGGQFAAFDVPDTGDPDHIATEVASVFARGLSIAR